MKYPGIVTCPRLSECYQS